MTQHLNMRATDWGKKDIRLGRNKKLRRKQIGYGAGLNELYYFIRVFLSDQLLKKKTVTSYETTYYLRHMEDSKL